MVYHYVMLHHAYIVSDYEKEKLVDAMHNRIDIYCKIDCILACS